MNPSWFSIIMATVVAVLLFALIVVVSRGLPHHHYRYVISTSAANYFSNELTRLPDGGVVIVERGCQIEIHGSFAIIDNGVIR